MNRLLRLFCMLLSLFYFLSSTAFGSEKVFFYHTDPAGTPIAMTDSIGNTVWTADYRPFGEEQSTPGIIDNNREFIGKEKDSESGMSYFGARYTRSEIGRFISPDPVSAVDPHSNKTNEKLLTNPQRLNLYKYGLNNPYKYVDINGLFESWGILRATVPGQIQWDNAITSFEGGSYVEGGVYLAAMLSAQVLYVATLGRSPVGGNVAAVGNKLLWTTWENYPKVIMEGREYAQIGERLYTLHAVKRMMPSGLTTEGRSISPNFIEDIIRNTQPITKFVNGVERQIFRSGSTEVVTEQGGKIVVTVNPFKY